MPFVPDDFPVPRNRTFSTFRLEALGPEHNVRDHATWSSSMEHIHRTPGFEHHPWPIPMTLEENLENMDMHAREFDERTSFTWSILELDSDEVIGCVYLYPEKPPVPGRGRFRSWVSEAHAARDEQIRGELRDWFTTEWPLDVREGGAPRPVEPVPSIDEIIEFWFGTIAEDGRCDAELIKRWWGKNPDFDKEITERFGPAIAAAEAGELDEWKQGARGCLALILLCDQMTRNSRRDSSAMFDADRLAQNVLRHALDQGFEKQLRTMECYFLLMPLMHAESRELQREGIERFDELVTRAEAGAKEAAEGAAEYMRKHEVIVARFGRFPHRNALLDRESTPEEVEFLEQPGSSF